MTKTLIAAAAVIALMTGKVSFTQTDMTKLGGYTETENTAVTPEMQKIFDEAMNDMIGVNYTAKEMIGKQIVNGTNYRFLCDSQVVYPGAEKEEVIVTVHVTLDGSISVLSIENI